VAKRGNFARHANILTTGQIYRWHDAEYTSLDWFYSKDNPSYASKFIGYSDEEVVKKRKDHLRELETQSSFFTLATIEAWLVIDYQTRVRKRLKDPLSKYFRQHDQEFIGHITLNNDIFNAWQQHHPELKRDIGILKGAMEYRHWLAHGRHWSPKFPKHQYDFVSVYHMATTIENEFPLAKP